MRVFLKMRGPGVQDGAGVGRGGLCGAAGGKWSFLRHYQHHCHAKPNLGQLSRGEQTLKGKQLFEAEQLMIIKLLLTKSESATTGIQLSVNKRGQPAATVQM